ncbi:MAG TPA: hypothetical protein VML92_01245 [Steroidobacteraceae bacterium]|nr:hypothetical protein [Steroidobacteraceae bacterium]
MNQRLPTFACLLLTACCGVAAAADQLDAYLLECRKQADHQARLECYDRLADRIAQQTVTGEARLGENIAAAKQSAERSFGRPDPGAADEPGAAPAVTPDARAIIEAARVPEQITSRVVRIERGRDGRIIVYLENDQVWAETNASRFRGRLAAGEEVTVSKEGFGWYRMRFKNTYGVVAVRRVQ